MALTGPPDEEYYLTLVEEVYRGGQSLESPFWGGYEDARGAPLPSFSIRLTGLFQRIFDLSPKSMVLLSDILLPLAVFYLIFALGKRLKIGFKSAILAAFISMSSPFLFFGEPAIPFRCFSLPKWEVFDYFLPMSRIINPQAGIVFFMGALALWVDFGRSFWRSAACLALSAFSMASNLYMGITLMAFWGLEIVIELIFCRRALRMALFFSALAATSVPLLLKWMELKYLAEKFPDMYMMNLVGARLPLVSVGEIVAAALLLIHVFLRRSSLYENARDRFVLLSTLTYVATMNQQVVTGMMVDNWHYEYYVFNFILPVMVLAVASEWRESKPASAASRILRGKRPAAFLFIAFMAFSYADGMVEQLYGYKTVKNWQIGMEKEYKAPFQWMNSHLGYPNVFLAWPFPTRMFPSDVTSYIPIYTRQKVFMSSASTFYPTPGLKESQRRQLIVLALAGFTGDEFSANVIKNNGICHEFFFHKSYYQKKSLTAMLFDTTRLPSLTSQEILDAIRQYEGFRKYSAEELFRLERIDYLYWGPSEKYYFTAIDPARHGFLEKAFSADNVEIYRVRH